LDDLVSPPLNFTGSNTTLKLKFDVSYRLKSAATADTLKVFISTDCGGSWSKIYQKGGTQLSTNATAVVTPYTPTVNTQWRRDSVSLSTYSLQPVVYLKFESKSGDGNNVYLDNINVAYTPAAAAPNASFSVAATKCSGSAISLSDQSANSPTSWYWSLPGGTPSTASVQNPSVTYSASGVYTISLASANATGTSTPVSQTISVVATPVVAANNATICAGTPTNLTASGATTYSWNTGATTSSISVSPTTPTSYTVIGTTSSCKNTKVVNVAVNALPIVSLASITNPLCINSGTVALSGAPTNGTYTGTGVSGAVFNPATAGAGTFTVNYYYTNANNCSSFASRSVVVSLCTGITELDHSFTSVYPNPVKDVINVSIESSLVNQATIEIYDAIGKMIIKEKVSGSLTAINVESLAKGIYVLRIVSGANQVTKRIVKE